MRITMTTQRKIFQNFITQSIFPFLSRTLQYFCVYMQLGQSYNKLELDILNFRKHTISLFLFCYCLGISYLILTPLRLANLPMCLYLSIPFSRLIEVNAQIQFTCRQHFCLCLFLYKCEHSIDISQ